jgi:hypothetical protein
MDKIQIKQIPAEYLSRVKGNVSDRVGLASKAELPEIVVSRLSQDRSMSVLMEVASRNDLTLEQVKTLNKPSRIVSMYDLRRRLFRNHDLSHECVKYLIAEEGLVESSILANPNIKAKEFIGIVKEQIELERSRYSVDRIIKSALSNRGIGNTILIALLEHIKSEHQYESLVEILVTHNESLTPRSIEWLWKQTNTRMKKKLLGIPKKFISSVTAHLNCSDELINKIVLGLEPEYIVDLFGYAQMSIRENYVASREVVELLASQGMTGPDQVIKNTSIFIANHMGAVELTDRITQQLISVRNKEVQLALLKNGVLAGTSHEREAVDIIVSSSDELESVEWTYLEDSNLITEEHMVALASHRSWRVRQSVAESRLVPLAQLEVLANDDDSDVERSATQNGRYYLIKHSVEYQRRAESNCEEMKRIHRGCSGVVAAINADSYAKDYTGFSEFGKAIELLASPEFSTFIETFSHKDRRELMKDGIDLDTLNLLSQFF